MTTSRSLKFQSRAGFSGRLDTRCTDAGSTGVRSFNPVLGFLGVSTSERIGRVHRRHSFNPVLGFLGVSTGPTDARPCERQVSIPCWVFWASRLHRRLYSVGDRLVSIPCWVFWASRQRHDRHSEKAHQSFNPVLGFLGVSTSLFSSSTSNGVPCFNPVLGFLGVSTRVRREPGG